MVAQHTFTAVDNTLIHVDLVRISAAVRSDVLHYSTRSTEFGSVWHGFSSARANTTITCLSIRIVYGSSEVNPTEHRLEEIEHRVQIEC